HCVGRQHTGSWDDPRRWRDPCPPQARDPWLCARRAHRASGAGWSGGAVERRSLGLTRKYPNVQDLRCGRAVTIAAFGILFAGAGLAGDVKAFANPDSNFGSYKTYRWLPTKVLSKAGIVEDDPALSAVIKTAVNRELAARGLTEVVEGGDLE